MTRLKQFNTDWCQLVVNNSLYLVNVLISWSELFSLTFSYDYFIQLNAHLGVFLIFVDEYFHNYSNMTVL